MPQCETCGNEYDKAMQITGKSHWFDSCDFAIHALASSCAYCRCKVIGRCAKEQGLRELDDRK